MTELQKIWEFVEEFHPNYSNSDRIARDNDLQRLIDLEFDPNDGTDNAKILYDDISNALQTKSVVKILKKARQMLDKTRRQIYEKSILGYLDSLDTTKSEKYYH